MDVPYALGRYYVTVICTFLYNAIRLLWFWFYHDKYSEENMVCHLELCSRNKELSTFSLLCRSLPLPPSSPSSPSRFKLIYCVIVSPQRQEINKSKHHVHVFTIYFLPAKPATLLKLLVNFFLILWQFFSGHHYTYEPLKCERYLGHDTWCPEEFNTSYERKSHREKCAWVCGEPGCGKTGETRKRDIDKHTRKHDSEKAKRLRHSQFEIGS